MRTITETRLKITCTLVHKEMAIAVFGIAVVHIHRTEGTPTHIICFIVVQLTVNNENYSHWQRSQTCFYHPMYPNLDREMVRKYK